MTSTRTTLRHMLRLLAVGGVGIGLLAAAAACSAATGGQVSFLGPTIEGVRDIHLVDADGSNRTRLFTTIRGLADVFYWLPDGERALVLKEEDGKYYVANPASGTIGECVTCAFDHFGQPAFSPNGRQIAWGDRHGIYLLNTEDFELTKVSDVERPGWISWSPDSRSLAFTVPDTFLQIYRLDVREGTLQLLTRYPDSENVYHFAPAWSLRRDQIAFHTLDEEGFHLMVMDSDGSNLRKLADWKFAGEIFEPGLQDEPQWSPDGRRLLFVAASELGDTDIFVVNVDGSELENLTAYPGNDSDPVWSPNGKLIAFVTNRGGNDEIYVMNADGSEPRNISQMPVTPEEEPKWRP